MKRWGLVVLVACMVSGCAFIREIPANSTPLRTARYYRTQDLANVAGGAAADQLLVYVVRGPYRCGEWGHYCGSYAPFARVGLVGALGLVRRQTDKGYRESGLFMNLAGAYVAEWFRYIVWGLRGKP